MDYCSDIWIGYLTGMVLNRCVKLSLQRCPGCAAKLKCPILHQHEQSSLLDKIRLYFDEVRGVILSSVDRLYDMIQRNLPHSSDLKKDKEIYCNNGALFLTTANPDSIYWGRYIDELNDAMIDSMVTTCLQKKIAK